MQGAVLTDTSFWSDGHVSWSMSCLLEHVSCMKLATYYKLSYIKVWPVFLAPVSGYCVAALSTNLIHIKFGQRGIAFPGPFSHLLAIYCFVCSSTLPLPCHLSDMCRLWYWLYWRCVVRMDWNECQQGATLFTDLLLSRCNFEPTDSDLDGCS